MFTLSGFVTARPIYKNIKYDAVNLFEYTQVTGHSVPSHEIFKFKRFIVQQRKQQFALKFHTNVPMVQLKTYAHLISCRSTFGRNYGSHSILHAEDEFLVNIWWDLLPLLTKSGLKLG